MAGFVLKFEKKAFTFKKKNMLSSQTQKVICAKFWKKNCDDEQLKDFLFNLQIVDRSPYEAICYLGIYTERFIEKNCALGIKQLVVAYVGFCLECGTCRYQSKQKLLDEEEISTEYFDIWTPNICKVIQKNHEWYESYYNFSCMFCKWEQEERQN